MKRQKIFHADEPTFDVCPYLYHKCLLPAGGTCRIREWVATAVNLTAWAHAVDKAAGCRHLGEQITQAQYEHRRMGVFA